MVVVLERSIQMNKTLSLSDTIAWSFLLPGTLACNALGLNKRGVGEYSNLVRMLVNSLVWTVFGVIVVAYAS
jgi:uncharacterized membrane protein